MNDRPDCPDPIECHHEAAAGDANERLAAIQQLASALKDYLPGDAWHLAHAIEQIASGHKTVAEAMAEVEE